MGTHKDLHSLIVKTKMKMKLNQTLITKLLQDIEILDGDNKDLELKLKFYEDTEKLKPTILYKQGRGKNYIYGRVVWYSNGFGSKKKRWSLCF